MDLHIGDMQTNKIIYISLVLVLISCKPKDKDFKLETYNDSTYAAVQVDVDDAINDAAIDAVKVPLPKRLWDGKNIKLPSGKVISMDYSKSKKTGVDFSDNYVVIKNGDSLLTIYRDIDMDTYLALQIGDLIKNN